MRVESGSITTEGHSMKVERERVSNRHEDDRKTRRDEQAKRVNENGAI